MGEQLIVEGGVLVNGSSMEPRDLLIEDGRIAAIGRPGAFRGLECARLDAAQRYILPGAIDAHVHSRDPGFPMKEDITSLTEGALKGGVTTFLEMPNTIPPVHDAETFRSKTQSYVGRSYTDYGLWGLILGDLNRSELERLASEGVVGFKLFWGYALDPHTYELVYNPSPGQEVIQPFDEAEILAAFGEVARLNRPFAVHTESKAIVDRRTRENDRGLGPSDPYQELLYSRPPIAEAHLIRTAASIAQEVRGHLHIVHLSSSSGVEAVKESRRLGVRVTVETCPHYLTLSAEDYARIGPIMKCYPPIRTSDHRQALWQALLDGEIDTIGSDHAPHTVEEKIGPLRNIPAGFPGVELMLPLMLEHVAAGRLSLSKVVQLTAENPAKLFGIDHRKGFLKPGMDADLCLVSLDHTWEVKDSLLASKSKATPYNGMMLRGKVTATVLRGSVVMMDGKVLGTPSGRMVQPQD